MSSKNVPSERDHGGADTPKAPNISLTHQHQETNLNIGPQLRFPSVEQIHVLEKYCPGFTGRVVALMQKETEYRHGTENRYLEQRHEFDMKRLYLEHWRMMLVILLIVAIAVASIMFFAKGKNAAGSALAAVFLGSSLAALVHSAKSKK